ncbi:MAG: cytochrome P450 [Linnemannia elongata]|nr:MAG: cytochrome P450 [Linnemannia elongata]
MSSTVATSSVSSAAIVQVLKQLLTRTNVAKILGTYLIYLTLKYRRTAYGIRTRTDLPGPMGLPFLGNTYQLVFLPRNEVLQRQTANHEKYGPVYTMTIPGIGRIINILDPEMIDHVLRVNFWAYEKGPFLRTQLGPLVGGGIFGADGHQWKWQRKLASHIFNVKSFRSYTSTVFCKEADLVIDYLNIKADRGEVVDLQDVFYKYTLDSFGEIAFGQSFGCLDRPGDEVPFAAAFDRLNQTLSERFISPMFKIISWYKGHADTIDRDSKIVSDFTYDIIQQRREEGHGKDYKDLLQLFMEAQDENGEALTDEMLKDTMNNFILAGRDTTAQALSWMFYLIHRDSADKSVLQRLRDETEQVLQGTLPTYESTKLQKFAEACFYEALRLYPSVPKNMKTCVEDDVLPGGTRIYKGERIGWSSYAMGRSTAVWGPDAKEYKPERWLSGEKPSQSKFVSFHLGPRTCLGQAFATIEAITLMSMLVERFDFELVDPKKEPAYVPSLTMPMDSGLPVRVIRRHPKA